LLKERDKYTFSQTLAPGKYCFVLPDYLTTKSMPSPFK
jgi:hypothetical protein